MRDQLPASLAFEWYVACIGLKFEPTLRIRPAAIEGLAWAVLGQALDGSYTPSYLSPRSLPGFELSVQESAYGAHSGPKRPKPGKPLGERERDFSLKQSFYFKVKTLLHACVACSGPRAGTATGSRPAVLHRSQHR